MKSGSGGKAMKAFEPGLILQHWNFQVLYGLGKSQAGVHIPPCSASLPAGPTGSCGRSPSICKPLHCSQIAHNIWAPWGGPAQVLGTAGHSMAPHGANVPESIMPLKCCLREAHLHGRCGQQTARQGSFCSVPWFGCVKTPFVAVFDVPSAPLLPWL